jgi:hypothetical protein
MSDWKTRLTKVLEPILREPDPRPKISVYHDMPCAIFHYLPECEWAVRREVAMLRTRLEQAGKRVTPISLAECLTSAIKAEKMTVEEVAQAEREAGPGALVETLHAVLDDYQPLDTNVARMVPEDADPRRDIIFLTRAGALYPFYRTSALMEQLKGKVKVPVILLYPGTTDGVSALSFMGVMEPDANYRPKIF